jgi:hypothetical protein
LLSTGRSPVHIHIQQHMAMLRAEAGLVNSWCIYGFKLTRGLRAESRLSPTDGRSVYLAFPSRWNFTVAAAR